MRPGTTVYGAKKEARRLRAGLLQVPREDVVGTGALPGGQSPAQNAANLAGGPGTEHPKVGESPCRIQHPPSLSDTDLARLDETCWPACRRRCSRWTCRALDGYLCGVLLQPRRVPPARWLPWCRSGRPPRAGRAGAAGTAGAGAAPPCRAGPRHRRQRDWFDPWIYQLDDDADPSECLLPWVAGFAAAMEAFPALMAMSDPELVEPLALLFMHFDPDDLEDADALAAVIETLEPPPTWPRRCRTPCVR
jgi:hypothetical protein